MSEHHASGNSLETPFDLSDCTPRQCKCGATVYDAPPLAGLLPMEKDGRTHSTLVCEVRAQLAEAQRENAPYQRRVKELTEANAWLSRERQELLEARVQLEHVRGPSLPCGHHPEHRRESGSHVFCTLCITRKGAREDAKRATDHYKEIQRLRFDVIKPMERRLSACEPVIEVVRELQEACKRCSAAEAKRDQAAVVQAIGEYNAAARKLRQFSLPAKAIPGFVLEGTE